jgi:hypothetical protein
MLTVSGSFRCDGCSVSLPDSVGCAEQPRTSFVLAVPHGDRRDDGESGRDLDEVVRRMANPQGLRHVLLGLLEPAEMDVAVARFTRPMEFKAWSP